MLQLNLFIYNKTTVNFNLASIHGREKHENKETSYIARKQTNSLWKNCMRWFGRYLIYLKWIYIGLTSQRHAVISRTAQSKMVPGASIQFCRLYKHRSAYGLKTLLPALQTRVWFLNFSLIYRAWFSLLIHGDCFL